MELVDQPGRVPYPKNDTTRSWVETVGRQNGLLKPQILLRIATDTHYVLNHNNVQLYGDTPRRGQTKSMMNVALPGQRIPGIYNWNVTENIDQVTQAGSFEALNTHLVSTYQTTLTTALDGGVHNLTLKATWAQDSLFVVEKATGTGTTRPGNNNITKYKDSQGYYFREENVMFRLFNDQQFTTASSTGFPDPAIPQDDDNDVPNDANWPSSTTGAGSYYIQIDDEVVRVVAKSGNTFNIPPGGRAVNGVLQAHAIGAPVKLLNFGPFTGEWVGMGYMNVDDFNPQKAILRPGTCLVSYEGWGDIQGPLTHLFNPGKNYVFTGYWFVVGIEPSLSDDGTPRVRVDLESAGHMFETQKITPHLLQRIKTQYGQWRIGEKNQTIWGSAGHSRDIPGDWVDYSAWNPDLPGAYPMKINIELAQHKEFMEHMNSTNMGLDCEFCQQERKDWLKTHENPDTLARKVAAMAPGVARTKLADRQAELALLEAKAIGRHIYKESIRVMNAEAGPIKTYLRLVSTIAAAAWDHPAYGTELAQRFTKIPSKLFDNIRNMSTGLVYNGQLDFSLDNSDADYEFSRPTYQDVRIISRRRPLTCPFSSTYDKAPFSQPMKDLADVNGATFWVNREGYPVFVPRLFPLRPSGKGFRDLAKAIPYPSERNEWFMYYGGSIASYSHSLNSSAVITQCIVTGTDAFQNANPVTVYAGGTGFSGNDRITYSPLAGNKEGLALTSGVQQTETTSLDNQVLGLDWNTKPETWGLKQEISNNTVVLNALPPLYDGSPSKTQGDKGKAVVRIKLIVNFFLERGYMAPFFMGSLYVYALDANDDRYTAKTKEGVRQLQLYLLTKSTDPGMTGLPALTANGTYNRTTYLWITRWLSIAKHYIRFDIFWYIMAGLTWDHYVAAITGVPVPFRKTSGAKNPVQGGDFQVETPKWIIDDKGMQQEVSKWHKTFAQSMVNVGNRVVDDSINKATARSINCNIADPRIQPGDVIWCEVPGFLGSRNTQGENRPPFTNGIYVNSITRSMDLTAGTYTASYSGYRFRGVFDDGLSTSAVNSGYDFIT